MCLSTYIVIFLLFFLKKNEKLSYYAIVTRNENFLINGKLAIIITGKKKVFNVVSQFVVRVCGTLLVFFFFFSFIYSYDKLGIYSLYY